MAEPSAERIAEALAQAAKMDSAYGPLGASLGIYQLKDLYQEMRDFLSQALARWESLQAEIKAAEAYKAALETHVAELAQRHAELTTSNPPQERALGERLQAQHSQIRANEEEIARQQAALFSNRQHLSEQEAQIRALGQQVLGLQQQVQRRASMGVA
jgi:DNA repair exonuclease SbcCD ATPase subunit